jgi:hypothetical protein
MGAFNSHPKPVVQQVDARIRYGVSPIGRKNMKGSAVSILLVLCNIIVRIALHIYVTPGFQNKPSDTYMYTRI